MEYEELRSIEGRVPSDPQVPVQQQVIINVGRGRPKVGGVLRRPNEGIEAHSDVQKVHNRAQGWIGHEGDVCGCEVPAEVGPYPIVANEAGVRVGLIDGTVDPLRQKRDEGPSGGSGDVEI